MNAVPGSPWLREFIQKLLGRHHEHEIDCPQIRDGDVVELTADPPKFFDSPWLSVCRVHIVGDGLEQAQIGTAHGGATIIVLAGKAIVTAQTWTREISPNQLLLLGPGVQCMIRGLAEGLLVLTLAKPLDDSEV